MSKKTSPIKVDVNTAEYYTWDDNRKGCAVTILFFRSAPYRLRGRSRARPLANHEVIA